MTRPRALHQRTALGVGSDLRDPFEKGRGGPGAWSILPEPGIELPSTPEIAPSLAGWRQERLPILPAEHAQPSTVVIGVRALRSGLSIARKTVPTSPCSKA